MQTNKLLMLCVIAIGLCAGAYYLYQNQSAPQKPLQGTNSTQGGAALGERLLASLDNDLEKIARVEIKKKKESIVLAKGEGDDWKIETANGYPADPKKINELVLGLSEMKVNDRLTANAERYSKFGLKDETEYEASVSLTDSAQKEIATLYLGKDRKSGAEPDMEMGMPPKGGGRYVKLASDPNVYLVEDDIFKMNPALSAWVDTSISSVPADKIVKVSIAKPTTATVELAYQNGKLELQNIPPDRQAKKAEVDSMASALNGLRMTDVLAVDSPKTKDLVFDTTFTATSKDGTIYTVAVSRKDGQKDYIKLSAAYGEPFLTDADKATTQTQAAAQTAATQAKEAVPEFNKKHGPWVYEVSGWIAEKFMKTQKALTESNAALKTQAGPPEPSAPGEEAAPAASGPAGKPVPVPSASPENTLRQMGRAKPAKSPAAPPAQDSKKAPTPQPAAVPAK
jgi:hypothetical protein